MDRNVYTILTKQDTYCHDTVSGCVNGNPETTYDITELQNYKL
ncbi:MAG TPA: hypothetical protein PK047_12355 [Saprospiraceae bacterium]|nr:hypothetical protein [Saprospiraceae bacterium]